MEHHLKNSLNNRCIVTMEIPMHQVILLWRFTHKMRNQWFQTTPPVLMSKLSCWVCSILILGYMLRFQPNVNWWLFQNYNYPIFINRLLNRICGWLLLAQKNEAVNQKGNNCSTLLKIAKLKFSLKHLFLIRWNWKRLKKYFLHILM